MTVIVKQDAFVAARIIELVAKERAMALSKREWMHRIAGYGYCIRDAPEGQIIETLPHHVPVCALPLELAA